MSLHQGSALDPRKDLSVRNPLWSPSGFGDGLELELVDFYTDLLARKSDFPEPETLPAIRNGDLALTFARLPNGALYDIARGHHRLRLVQGDQPFGIAGIGPFVEEAGQRATA
jgi:hypothetical protein